MTQILLVGTEQPLLEGLAQLFAAQGFAPVVAQSLHDAREAAAHHPPLIVVVSRALAATASAETKLDDVQASAAEAAAELAADVEARANKAKKTAKDAAEG